MRKIHKSMLVILASLILFALTGCSSSDAEKKVASLVILQEPDKTWYIEGETFDTTGLKVSAKYTDGSMENDVAYEIDAEEVLKIGDDSVEIKYGGKNVWQSIHVDYIGNSAEYSVENTMMLENSSLQGKVYFFLGSSITYGSSNEEGGASSMADYIGKRNNCTIIKEAVSGTTLAQVEKSPYGKNYTDRLDDYLASEEKVDKIDAFICQLSTNDTSQVDDIGSVTDKNVVNPADFDRTTTVGAIEYIIATAKQTWDCPVIFYTNSWYENEDYPTMINLLKQVAQKWDITIIDLYNDAEFNNITDEQRVLYLKEDGFHPTKAGYREWWVVEFEKVLGEL